MGIQASGCTVLRDSHLGFTSLLQGEGSTQRITATVPVVGSKGRNGSLWLGFGSQC